MTDSKNRTKKNWTKEEDAFLELKAGAMPADLIAKHLHRSVHSVYWRIHHLGLSLTIESDNWPANNLADLLKVPTRTVHWWINSKKLKTNQIKSGRGFRHHVSRKNFKAFYFKYRDTLPTLQKANPDALEFILNG